MSTVRILGIDPGFDRVGICILDTENGVETLVYSTCIVTNKKDIFEARLSYIGNTLANILQTYVPNELAIESLFFTKNQKTAIAVAEVRGVCLYLSHINGVQIFEYSPPQIKLAIAGHGKASKQDITYMLPKILKKAVPEGVLDDELDAIAIALTHSAQRVMRRMTATIKRT